MKNNRRNFLKLAGLTGFGLASNPFSSAFASAIGSEKGPELDYIRRQAMKKHKQVFNMCGYAAAKIDTVRTGFIGLGHRGPTHVKSLLKMEGTDIKALCDLVPENLKKVQLLVDGSGHEPQLYQGKDDWKKVCERKDIDLIYIATPWDFHVPMALYAMEQGKHVAVEVPAAVSVDECWQLVNASEKSRKHCMMLENCCYDFFELLTLNMARQGYFGEIIHTEGAYIHTLLELNFQKEGGYWDMWRLKENIRRNGNLYPTHGLGPVCQVMNINRGDKMDYMVSMSGDDFLMAKEAKELAAKDPFYAPFVNQHYRGNMNTTTIRTAHGKTIMVQHDVTSPNVYSRIHKISGTKSSALKYPLPGKVAKNHKEWLSDEEMKALEEKYQPEIVKKIGSMAKKVGGHGGMDFLMNWRLIDCLRNGLPLDQDVYDAALWSVISPLSEWSVANRSTSIDIPDFTNGAWSKNTPVDISMAKGGTTLTKN